MSERIDREENVEMTTPVTVDVEPKKSKSPFTDRFFRFDRVTTTLILGNHSEKIFAKLTVLDLNGEDACRMLDAAAIVDHGGQWCIGVFNEPVVIARELYPKDTVAVFQGRKPGKRFVLFSLDPDETQPEAFEV
jgi:hypothetical protein